MREEPGQRATDGRAPSAWARIRLLPRPVLLLVFPLLFSAQIPAVAGLVAVFGPAYGPTWLARLAGSPALASSLSLAVALGSVLVVERPGSWRPLTYARQLHGRFAEIQCEFDGALRRRLGGEGEKRHAPEAHPSEP